MNINTLTIWNPKSIRECWHWVPKVEHYGWRLKNGGHVWYFNVQWLNSRLDIDNEE